MRAAPIKPLRCPLVICQRCGDSTMTRSGESKAEAQERHESDRPMCRGGAA